MEFSGSEAAVEHDVATAREISECEGCEAFESEEDEEGREKLWEVRHEAAFAIEHLNPDKKLMSTDVCVPISCLPGALREARKTIEAYGLDGAILGHVCDGNYLAAFPVYHKNEVELETA